MSRFIAAVSLSLAGLALSDPVPCHGNACPVENDQAAMLQSSLLRKGETSDSMVADENGRRRRRRRRKRRGSWGPETDHKYCSGSYDKQSSRGDAKRACKDDEACGGIYQPGNDPGSWFLCKGFDTYSSNSNSVVIEKLSGSSPSPSPSSPSYDDNRRRSSPSPSSSCWGSKVSGYCSGSYGGGVCKSEAESACMNSTDCGGVYEPGNEPGKWYLCKGFNLFTSTSGSQSIKKECDATPSPSPSYDDDRRRRERYPSPSPSSSCWGTARAGYCSGSYGGGESKSEAETACKDAAECGGIYESGNEPGKWYLCKGFDLYTSTSGSQSIKKECDAISSPSPSPSDSDDRRRRLGYPSPSPSSSCWGRVQDGYCSGSYNGHSSQSDAESACVRDAECGGIYQPGNEPGQWYLCKGFDVYGSTSGGKSIKNECSSSQSPSPPPPDDDRRRRDPYPSPSPSQGGSTCHPCSYSECQSNQCASHNRFMCTSGSAKGGCNGGSSYWASTGACNDCCDTSYC